jgi:Cof subfamily protein (haloacid dehalogenase superfamily)
MRYKALAFDLDGTLLTSGESVSDRNVRALKAARDAGLLVILASARWYQLAERVAREVGAAPPVVACSGAQVRRLDDGRDRFDVRLPAAFAAELYAICDRERCIATVAGEEDVFVKLEGNIDPSLAPKEMRFVPALAGAMAEQPRIALIQGSAATAVIERELAPRWSDRVQFVESISSYGKPILTLTATGADKGVALGVACEDLGITLDEVVAFGDSDNDLEMFRVAGAAVAMGQAEGRIKAAATFVSAPNHEDGVAVAVERLLTAGDLH